MSEAFPLPNDSIIYTERALSNPVQLIGKAWHVHILSASLGT